MSQTKRTKNAFSFYRSYFEALEMIPNTEDRLKLFEALCRYGLDQTEPELEYPLNAFFVSMRVGCDYARSRYDQAVAGGEKGKKYGALGGRPEKQIDRQKVEESYARLGNWRAVAKDIGVNIKTLQKRRIEWMEADGEKPKTTQC